MRLSFGDWIRYTLIAPCSILLLGQLSNAVHAQVRPIAAGEIVLDYEAIVTSSTLQFPVYATHAGDGSGRLFVVDRPGRIHVLHNDQLVAEPFLNLAGEVVSSGERGLLSLAFHPDFSEPTSTGFRKLYTYHTTEQMQPADFTVGAPTHQNVITEWQVDPADPNRVDLSTRREILRVDHRGMIHLGSIMAFDNNAYLYISFGDPNESHGQNKATAQGTIFRVDPLDPSLTDENRGFASTNGSYRVPATNPFLDDEDAIDEIYAHGFRNPWRGSFDRETDLLFLGDVGQGAREEVDVIVAGGNYGWSWFEGTRPHRNPPDDPSGVTWPLAEYDHGDGRAVVGGYVYRGDAIPWLEGLYVFGDLTSSPPGQPYSGPGPLFYLDPYDEGGQLRQPGEAAIYEFGLLGGKTTGAIITSFAEDEDGELYFIGVVGNRGTVRRILAGPAPLEGDYNGNGIVEQADLDLVLGHWGADGSSHPENWINDLPEGLIDQGELDAVLAGWGQSYPSATAASVPEPTTLFVLVALVGVAAARRRPRRT